MSSSVVVMLTLSQDPSNMDSVTSHRVLAHPQGFVGQVAWSPKGDLLLTKMNRGIKVWNDGGVCKKTIDRKQSVLSVAWLPGGEGVSPSIWTTQGCVHSAFLAFLSVEGSYVTKMVRPATECYTKPQLIISF